MGCSEFWISARVLLILAIQPSTAAVVPVNTTPEYDPTTAGYASPYTSNPMQSTPMHTSTTTAHTGACNFAGKSNQDATSRTLLRISRWASSSASSCAPQRHTHTRQCTSIRSTHTHTHTSVHANARTHTPKHTYKSRHNSARTHTTARTNQYTIVRAHNSARTHIHMHARAHTQTDKERERERERDRESTQRHAQPHTRTLSGSRNNGWPMI
jgi:hypothetical protein